MERFAANFAGGGIAQWDRAAEFAGMSTGVVVSPTHGTRLRTSAPVFTPVANANTARIGAGGLVPPPPGRDTPAPLESASAPVRERASLPVGREAGGLAATRLEERLQAMTPEELARHEALEVCVRMSGEHHARQAAHIRALQGQVEDLLNLHREQVNQLRETQGHVAQLRAEMARLKADRCTPPKVEATAAKAEAATQAESHASTPTATVSTTPTEPASPPPMDASPGPVPAAVGAVENESQKPLPPPEHAGVAPGAPMYAEQFRAKNPAIEKFVDNAIEGIHKMRKTPDHQQRPSEADAVLNGYGPRYVQDLFGDVSNACEFVLHLFFAVQKRVSGQVAAVAKVLANVTWAFNPEVHVPNEMIGSVLVQELVSPLHTNPGCQVEAVSLLLVHLMRQKVIFLVNEQEMRPTAAGEGVRAWCMGLWQQKGKKHHDVQLPNLVAESMAASRANIVVWAPEEMQKILQSERILSACQSQRARDCLEDVCTSLKTVSAVFGGPSRPQNPELPLGSNNPPLNL